MSALGDSALSLLMALIGAWLVPALGMRALVPSLASGGRSVANYRGRRVFLGLGLVWVFWSLGVMLAGWRDGLGTGPGTGTVLAAPVVLVLAALVFGLIDDMFGSSAEKGLKGHVRALLGGRLTTGGLKLIGIGLVALWTSASVGIVRAQFEGLTETETVVRIVLGTVVIAGCANLLNLLDLRPGRALKSYSALFLLAWVIGVPAALSHTSLGAGLSDHVAMAVWFLGPVLAVWRYDLGERGMLGDAGANPAGALAGLALAEALPVWGLAVIAVLAVALNLASERVSFTRVIEGNAALRWLDGLGRLSDVPVDPDRGT